MQKTLDIILLICHSVSPNFVRGLSFVDLFILASRIMIIGASNNAKQGITQCFDQEKKKILRKGKKGLFLDFSRP